jgi:peptidoglycan/LPS O-acetylase OafA/YrhL
MAEQADPLLQDYARPATEEGDHHVGSSSPSSSSSSLSGQFDMSEKYERGGLLGGGSAHSTVNRYRRLYRLRGSRIVRRCAAALGSTLKRLPPRYLQPGGLECEKRLHATSYLDALRGYAAWIVVNHHRFQMGGWWIFNLPLICIVNKGKGMVDVFFVISGFVLSQRMIKLIRARQKGKIMDSLASSIFRRYLRLYIPCAFASFVSMLTVHFWAAKQRAQPIPGFWAQLADWLVDTAQFCNPFAALTGYWMGDGGVLTSAYLDPLWTIPVEFRGSMVVFVYCAGTSKLRDRHRLTVCGVVIFLALAWQVTDVALFLAGAFLAEVSLIRHPGRYGLTVTLPRNNDVEDEKVTPSTPRRQSIASNLGHLCLFLFAIFLLDTPGDPAKASFPWPYLGALIPSYWGKGAQGHFWSVMASPMLVWSVDSCLWLQRPFRWRFSQYLGDLSFGIYLMHYIVIRTLWDKGLWQFVRTHFHGSPWTFVPITLIFWLAVLWVADYFERVDRQVVKFGRWLQTRYFESW